MPKRGSAVHVVTTTRQYKGKVYTTHLLRRSYRENGKVKNETVGNISHLPDHVIALIRRALQGETFAPVAAVFEITASRSHGHVQAVLSVIKRLGFDALLSSRPCRERDLVMAMVAARILEPHSKLATTRWWHVTTLPETLGVSDATEDDLYDAMDWLLSRQDRIEKKLAARHLKEGGLVLYDPTSSYFEGTTCPLAALGYSRDGVRGKLQVNYGLLASPGGCPVSVSVYEGNTGDPTTLLEQVTKVKDAFGIKDLVLVGDRGMITQKQIDSLKDIEGVDWISALKTGGIRELLRGGALQMGLFDERNLFELTHPDFPGERLIACRNRELARLRARKRQDLLEATTRELDKVKAMVEEGRIIGSDKIGIRVGRVINKYKMAKHIALTIEEKRFAYEIRQDQVSAEAALDGIYVIRTSLPKERISAEDAVRSYKSLSGVERAFRSLKSIDLLVRPIRHRLEDRVRAHIFLCMLSYYVEWHMLEAWRPLLFADEDQQAKAKRDPVAPAKRSEGARGKTASKRIDDDTTVHSFRTLLSELSGIVRNRCRRPGADPSEPTFEVTTTPNSRQAKALALLDAIRV
jgi:transposase